MITELMGTALRKSDSPYLKRERFIAEVRRNEEESKSDPNRYERKCRRIVLTGYVYVGLVMAVLLGLVAALVWLMVSSGRGVLIEAKLILILLIGVAAIGRALFQRLPDAKDGVEMSRHQAPKLWAEVDSIRESLKAPRVHRIRVNNEWNASASQVLLFGLFGPSKNTLRYGLPLMSAESPDEFRATVAHELGHFAGDHSRFVHAEAMGYDLPPSTV